MDDCTYWSAIIIYAGIFKKPTTKAMIMKDSQTIHDEEENDETEEIPCSASFSPSHSKCRSQGWLFCSHYVILGSFLAFVLACTVVFNDCTIYSKTQQAQQSTLRKDSNDVPVDWEHPCDYDCPLPAPIPSQSTTEEREMVELSDLVQEKNTTDSNHKTSTLREGSIMNKLVEVYGDIFKETILRTPYQQALQWILYEDPMSLNGFSENFIQRFTMALFYYQTSEQGPWRSCNPPENYDENSTCVFYELGRDPVDNSKIWTPRDELEIRWLSDRHECEWAEVQCTPMVKGNVTVIDIRKLR